jgi:hypothetical protein
MDALAWITLALVLVTIVGIVVGPIMAVKESDRRRKNAREKDSDKALRQDINLQRDVGDLKKRFDDWEKRNNEENRRNTSRLNRHLRAIYNKIDLLNNHSEMALLRERTKTNAATLDDLEERLRDLENQCASRFGFRTKRIDKTTQKVSDSGEIDIRPRSHEGD